VTRAIGLLVGNWPMKLGAIALAVVLYAGLALTQNTRTWAGRVPIEPVHQPARVFILGGLPDVTNIRYFAPGDAADRLSSAAFSATIDLAGVQPDPGSPFVAVPVRLLVADQSIRIIDFQPRQVFVRLDPIIERSIPVIVVQGTVPEGLAASVPDVSQTTVVASGPQSVVDKIVSAEARVRIQPSGIDVDQLVDLVAVDGRGERLQPVDLGPSSVRVRIQVGSQLTTRSVPLVPQISGTPGNGFAVASVTVSPLAATISGAADLLAGISSLETMPLSVDGATRTVTGAVELRLPEGVSLVGGAGVTATVTLRQQTSTRDFNIGVVIVGAASDRTYRIGAEGVVVTLAGGDQALGGVDATRLTGSIDVSGLIPGTYDLPIRLAVPSGLRLVTISPSQVNVVVIAPATPSPTATPAPVPPSPSPSPSA